MKYICLILATAVLLTAVGCTAPQNNADATSNTTVKTTAPLPQFGYITADSMRVRGEANLKAEIIGGINFGEKVEILGKNGDWYQIRFGDGFGYISGQYISFTAPTSTP